MSTKHKWVVIAVTRTKDGHNLPRPAVVREVLFIGSKEEAQERLDAASLLPIYQSSDFVEADVYMTQYNKQKSSNSRDKLPNSVNKYYARSIKQ